GCSSPPSANCTTTFQIEDSVANKVAIINCAQSVATAFDFEKVSTYTNRLVTFESRGCSLAVRLSKADWSLYRDELVSRICSHGKRPPGPSPPRAAWWAGCQFSSFLRPLSHSENCL